MGRTRIGLDIGGSGVRAVELSMRSIPPAVLRAAQMPLPDGAVQNGEIRDPAAVTEALKDLWRRGHFSRREVILGIANQKVVVREVMAPWLASEGELRASLPFQAQESIPIPMEEAIFDFVTLQDFDQDGRRMLRILLVVAQRDMVLELVSAVEAAHLRPVGLDLIPFAMVRSLGSIEATTHPAAEDAPAPAEEAIVNIGADITSICVHAGGMPRFVRILASGGRLVTAGVARSMGVSDAEAERLKRGYATTDEEAMLSTASAAANERAVSLAEEIHSSLAFYLAKLPEARVGQILLSGGGAQLEGLDALLGERMPDTVVRRANAFHRVRADLDLAPDLLDEAEPLLGVAVGLAIPGMHG